MRPYYTLIAVCVFLVVIQQHGSYKQLFVQMMQRRLHMRRASYHRDVLRTEGIVFARSSAISSIPAPKTEGGTLSSSLSSTSPPSSPAQPQVHSKRAPPVCDFEFVGNRGLVVLSRDWHAGMEASYWEIHPSSGKCRCVAVLETGNDRLRCIGKTSSSSTWMHTVRSSSVRM